MNLLQEYLFGGSQNGLEGFTAYNAPTDNGTYYTFNGTNQGAYDSTYLAEANYCDIYAKFRVHDKSKGIIQIIYKSGGRTNGIAIALDASGNLGIFGAENYNYTDNTIPVSKVPENTWLELYASKRSVRLYNAETGDLIDTKYGYFNSLLGSGLASIGYGYNSDPTENTFVTAPGGQHFFDGDISIVRIYEILDLRAEDVIRDFSLGSNNSGAGLYSTLVNAPTDNGTYYTFNGSNQGIRYSDSFGPILKYAFYAKFRVHDKNKGTAQTIFKIGNNTWGVTIGLGSGGALGSFAELGGTTYQIKFDVTEISDNVWYEIYASYEMLILINAETNAVVAEQNRNGDNANYDITSSSDDGMDFSIGYEYSSGPLTGATGGAYFDGDIERIAFYKRETLIPVNRKLGSNFPLNYVYASVGSPTDNGDFYTFDGSTDGFYFGRAIRFIDRNIYAKFRVHDKNKGNTQSIWKTGGSGTGVAIGLNASGDLGFFERYSSSLTEYTVDVSLVLENTWLEIFVTQSKLILKNYETGEVISNQDISINNTGSGNDAESIGYAVTSEVIGGSASAGDYFDGDIEIIMVTQDGSLFLPSELTSISKEILSTKIESSITDFVFRLAVSSSELNLAKLIDYYKYFFSVSVDSVDCYFQIEEIDPINERLILWVKSDLTNATTADIEVAFNPYDHNNLNAKAIRDKTSLASNIWRSTYEAVYHLNQSPGNNDSNLITDYSENSNNGDISGSMFGIDLSTSANDGYLTFDGTDDIITVSDDATIDFSTAFTIIAFVNLSSIPAWISGDNQRITILSKYDANGGYRVTVTDNNSQTTGVITFTIGDSSTTKNLNSNTALSTDTDYCIACTYDGSDLKIYINGTLDNSSTVGSQTIGATSDLIFPTQDDNGFNGDISEVLLLSEVLIASEIKLINYSLTNNLLSSPVISGNIYAQLSINGINRNVVGIFCVSNGQWREITLTNILVDHNWRETIIA